MNEVNFKNISFILLLLLILIGIAGIVIHFSTQDNSFIFTQINNPNFKDK